MRYHVDGADAETGQDRTITLDAGSEADARARAEEMGMVISNVRPFETAEDSTLQQYRGLNRCAAACFWVAGPAWIVASCAVVAALGFCATNVAGEGTGLALLAAVSFGLSGLLFAVLGHGLHALRDIAINTGQEEKP